MDTRQKMYEHDANLVASLFIRKINELEDYLNEDSVRIDQLLAHNGENRTITEIALDDLMDGFTTVMSRHDDTASLPSEVYYYLYQSRHGAASEQEMDEQMQKQMDLHRQELATPKMPLSLKILTPHLGLKQLIPLFNDFSGFLDKFTTAAATESFLGILNAKKILQNDIAQHVQLTIEDKQKTSPQKAIVTRKTDGSTEAISEGDDGGELADIAERLAKIDMPEKARETVNKVLKRTAKMPPQMPEYHTNLKRLETIADAPWGKFSESATDLQATEDILNADHYGLEDVKKRILQYLAVQKRTGQTKGKIICLIGPPGVGKTSIAASIAKSLGRNYARISLGGVHDEAKIRGHSSTYVGALPGSIMETISDTKTDNPLIVLDEIDKMGQDPRGDPTAAMLEALDPEQNHSFRDNFFGIEYDLSKVFFLATANDADTIPGPLWDRMHVIRLRPYQPEEKLKIATNHLLPKQMKQNGLDPETFSVTPEAIRTLISEYAPEAGVRRLEGKLNEICMGAVLKIETGHTDPIVVGAEDLKEYVGVPTFRRNTIPDEDSIGVVNGLSYSTMGGDVMQIEANLTPSSSGFQINLTGNLKDVMKESAIVAKSLIASLAPDLGIPDEKWTRSQIHVHPPAGAVPKDGPSAGTAFMTALLSSLTGIPVRRDVAMTGEVNLRGQVTNIGGLPEKLQGALAAGAKKVLVPKGNMPDLKDVAKEVPDNLHIEPVSTIEEVLEHALTEKPTPLSAPAPTARSWTTRFRDAWAVLKQASNDNVPAAPRQPAGPRRQPQNDKPGGAAL